MPVEKHLYLALLRGINVGGNNIIRMEELARLFEDEGFSGVKTYIQSGNVLFQDVERDKTKLARRIEKRLAAKEIRVPAALLTFSELRRIIEKKPPGFGEEKSLYRYDVIFLIEPLDAKDAHRQIKTREGVDTLWAGEGALYISRTVRDLSKSAFSKIAQSPVYQQVTVRNWNTTEKLYALMSAAAEQQ